MQRCIAVLALLITSVGYEGPVLYRITLIDGTVLPNLYVAGVGADAVRTVDGREFDLMRIRRIEEERGEIDQGVMLKSVSIGAGFGIVLGGVIGCALEGSRTRSIHGTSDTALEGALAGTGVGALMGLAAGCSEQQPAGVDVDGLPRYMRRDLIEQFLRERQEGGTE